MCSHSIIFDAFVGLVLHPSLGTLVMTVEHNALPSYFDICVYMYTPIVLFSWHSFFHIIKFDIASCSGNQLFNLQFYNSLRIQLLAVELGL